MPVSTAVELSLSFYDSEKVGFYHNEIENIHLMIPKNLWKELGKPQKIRVRFEDAWNDPNRVWE
jgi:hypothetical protein